MNDLQLELTRLIGKKELSFGTLISYKNEKGEEKFLEWYGIFAMNDWNDIYEIVDNGRDKWIGKDAEIIGKKASLSDFHRWIDSQKWVHYWNQNRKTITIDSGVEEKDTVYITYDSLKDQLEQDEETLKQIVELIKYHS